jgi:Zn-dependent peptidase ImmA (M78 family)
MIRPEDRAAGILRKYGIEDPPIPVENIADWIGALVIRNNFDGNESGFTLRDGSRTIIGVNTRTSRKRQRFTVAHEIGHVVLHESPLIVDQSVRMDWRGDVSSLGTEKQEIEANAFAAALLMPQRMVIDRAKDYSSHAPASSVGAVWRDRLISELAREFDVSTEAMGFRLVNLGVLAP